MGGSSRDEIGSYGVVSIKGSGDFATVYEVRQLQLDVGPTYALKLCHQGDRKSAERLRIEADSLKVLRPTGVPRFIEEGIFDGRPFLVMSLASSQTLQSRIDQNLTKNERFSDISTLEVLCSLLDTLTEIQSDAYPHRWGYGWVHRDIKPANVMISESGVEVTLIDFGFCKEAGNDDKRTDDSFFRVGSPRFSPPSKHDYPTHSRPSHDVFAVGVIAYLMLTNTFPWSATSAEGEGELVDLMRSTRPPAVGALNNTVRPEVDRFVDQIIRIDDSGRLTAAEALDTAEALLDSLSDRSEVGLGRIQPVSFGQVWRDEVHGDVRLTDFEMSLIDTPEMQRLRGVRQLGLTHYVYGGGDHNRLSHSVGTVYRVEQILRTIEQADGVQIDPETRLIARAYALTHDVTHIPFGHTLEDEFAIFERHDRNSPRIRRLVLGESSALGSRLQETEIGRQVRSLLDPDSGSFRRTEVEELVSGMVGADVLDYVNRDARNLGLDHRIDSAIFRQFRIRYPSGTSPRGRVVSLIRGPYGVRLDREYAIEYVMRERYALFLKAYNHRAKLAASAVLGKAIALALYEFKRAPLSETDIEWLSDDGLIDRLASMPRHQRVALLGRTLKRRELPIAVFRSRLLDDDNLNAETYRARAEELELDKGRFGLFPASKRLTVERELSRAHPDLGEDDVFVYASRSAPGFKRTQSHWIVRSADGSPIHPQSAWFAELGKKHLQLWDLWVFVSKHVADEVRGRAAAAAAERFGMVNEIDESGRRVQLW